MTLLLRLVALLCVPFIFAFWACGSPMSTCLEKYASDADADARCECEVNYHTYAEHADNRSFVPRDYTGRCFYDTSVNEGTVYGYTWVNENCPEGTELVSRVIYDNFGDFASTTDLCYISALSALGWPEGSTPSYVDRLPDCIGISPWNAAYCRSNQNDPFCTDFGYRLCRSWWPKPDEKECLAGMGMTQVSYNDVIPLVTYLNNSRQFSGSVTTVCVPTCATNRDGATTRNSNTGFCDSGLPIMVGCGIGDRCCDYRTTAYVRYKGAGNQSTWVELGLKCDPTNVVFYDSEIDCTPSIVSCAAAGSAQAIDVYRGGCAIGYSFNSESNTCDRTEPQEPKEPQ